MLRVWRATLALQLFLLIPIHFVFRLWFSFHLPVTMLPAARASVLRTARSQLRWSQPIAVPQYSAFARLASTFAVLEQKDGKFQPASLAAVTAGTKLGGTITAFIAGSGVKSVAEEIGKAKGIEKVIYVENGAYDKVDSIP